MPELWQIAEGAIAVPAISKPCGEEAVLSGIVGKIVTTNRCVAFTAQKMSVAIITAPCAFRSGPDAQIGGLDAAHSVGADLVFFP